MVFSFPTVSKFVTELLRAELIAYILIYFYRNNYVAFLSLEIMTISFP